MQITANLTPQENNHINIEQNTGKQVQQTDMPRELSLYNAVKGTVFQGDILDVRGSQVSIQVGNSILNALLENGINVNIGDRLSFLVKENTGAKVLLKPFLENGQAVQNSLIKTLEEASLPVTERNLTAVKELMSHGMPIDKNSMADIGRLLNQFKSANVETIISLKSHNLPVTQENIAQFEAYKNAEGKLLDQMNGIIKELYGMAQSGNDMESLGKTGELFGKLNELFQNIGEQTGKTLETPDGRVTGSPISGMTGHETAVTAESEAPAGTRPESTKQDISESMRLTSGGEQKAESAAKFHTENPPAGGQVNDSVKQLNPSADKMVQELRQQLVDEVRNMESNLKNRLLLTPEQLAQKGQQAIKDLYENIIKTTNKMMEILEASGEGKSKLMNAAGDLKNNMNFMSDFNEMAAYVQLPIKLNRREQTGELYVLSRKKTKKEQDESLTAFLHLDMEYLGATDVKVSLVNNRVSAKFTLDNNESMKLVEVHLPELKKRLEELGYSVSLSADEITEKKIPFERILEADKPTQKVKRYSFDVRA